MSFSKKMLKWWLLDILTFPYCHKESYLSVGAQSSQIYCTGTPAGHVRGETADILFDSNCLCRCSRMHPTTQVLVNRMNGEAMELEALHIQDVLNSELPLPL
jgi:hypothetical protein